MSTLATTTSKSPAAPQQTRMSEEQLLRYVNLKLAALGQPTAETADDPQFLELTGPLLRNHHQKNLLLGGLLCPVDTRVQNFLDAYLADTCPAGAPRLPSVTFVLDRPGIARVMSLPAKGDTFSSPFLNSYRVPQGVLHNPRADRRTTQGIFHITEGGLPVPADKIEVPKVAFARLLDLALQPPQDVNAIPFTAGQEDEASTFVSLLLRPLVSPATATEPERRMEIRFFAPGSLVCNLDFVEGIFGNGGDPFLPENDAALDANHFTGHTGCVILAPHLPGLRKKELGLPHWDNATERQRRDGMCWREEDELYNNGGAFKITCRDERGVMVTVIADNYFGYCKKEVKTQISYAANLAGNYEEEHAGGALAFPSYVLGYDFRPGTTVRLQDAPFEQSLELLGENIEHKPEGYAIDRNFPDVYYLPYGADFNVRKGNVSWPLGDSTHSLPLRPGSEYVLPAGYRLKLEKQPGGNRWRLIGTRPDGIFCHKPCTVSGGGKSEISKSITGAVVKGSIFVKDYRHDTERVAEILKMDTSSIFKNPPNDERAHRPILSPERSLGSVIKLLTPSPDYKDEYNEWLRQLPQTIRQYVCLVKRYYRDEWGDHWPEHFTVDLVNGYLGHELKYENLKLVGNYLRIGFEPDGSWRVFKLRPDFNPAAKVQMEDDISASVTVPRETVPYLDDRIKTGSVKLIENCEALLFQRPDDAIHRGIDKQAEADIASPGTLLCNFEPLTLEEAQSIVNRVLDFDNFTEPMQHLIRDFVDNPTTEWLVSSAHPRLVDGVPTENPRYLQKRPDVVNARDTYLAEVATRLARRVPSSVPIRYPVNAILPGRRNNPPDRKLGIPPLAVYNPIHYQELPELFMDFIASLTGKSPSTTGFGSEGALTKGPFNALPPVIDLNNALVSAILTEQAGFTTAAGYMGPNYRCDHDISMLVPEVWCRMKPEEREPDFLLKNGFLEWVDDFEYEGKPVLASRLGYRITKLFADRFLGRIFETPDIVFTEEILRPEKQDLEMFVAGVNAIVGTQAKVARQYFEDGSVEAACPPIRVLLHIMAHGDYEGMTAADPALRAMFSREALLESDWYAERLRTRQQREIARCERNVKAIQEFIGSSKMRSVPRSFDIQSRMKDAESMLEHVKSAEYLSSLRGMLGADPALGRTIPS